MTIIVNGKEKEIEGPLNLQQVIERFSQNHPSIIVELNGKIIKRENITDYPINPGDRLELIQLVGGG